jgi:hypothetical protein
MRLFAIKTMAEMGNYVAESWTDTARCMASTTRDAITDATQTDHA